MTKRKIQLPALVQQQNDQQTQLMQLIEKVVMNPEVDVAKMQAILDMKKDVMRTAAKMAFDADYVLMKPHLPAVVKKHKNTDTKSTYAKLEDINKTIDPVLAQFNFATMTRVVRQTEENVTVMATLVHSSGHSENTEVTIPLDIAGAKGGVNKTKVHGTGSAIKYASRYGVCLLLNISTGDDDDGNGAGGNIPKTEPVVDDFRQQAMLDVLMRCPQVTKDWFAEKYSSVKEVPVAQFSAVYEKLREIAGNVEMKAAPTDINAAIDQEIKDKQAAPKLPAPTHKR